MAFRDKVAFWLASYNISPDVLDHQKLKLPLANKDPIWVAEQLVRHGGPDCKALSGSGAMRELMVLTRESVK